jgi:hypothetical protein
MSDYFKYPSIQHLPWSPGLQNDDRLIENLEYFQGKEVVVTEKLDGENWALYNAHSHARSVDSNSLHPSRHWIKAFHASVKHLIPESYRLCGECVYAQHSIGYDALPTYFLLFGIFKNNEYLNWNDVKNIADNILGTPTVPVLYQGLWNEEAIKACYTGISKFGGLQEGYVVRVTDSFGIDEFPVFAAKYVRKDHVQCSEHWLHQKMIKNKLHI